MFFGVDGKELVENSETPEFWENTFGNMLVGEIGCALSHLIVWEKIASMSDNTKTLVFEDDAEINGPFYDPGS